MSPTQIPKELRIRTKIRQQTVSTIYYRGQMVPFLLRGGKIVHAARPIHLPQTAYRMVSDAEGDWFEFGFLSAHQLQGNATSGWTDPDLYLSIIPQNTLDMAQWSEGTFIPAPGGDVIDNGDGTYWYWARSVWPQTLKSAVVDYDLRSTRGGKSITSLRLHGATIPLTGYPYAIEADMPRLQSDLRATGYPQATATYTPAPYTADVIRHYLMPAEEGSTATQYVEDPFVLHYEGQAISAVYTGEATLIPLPGYPYALPSQAAQLQADLIAAGQSGSVVRLYAGEWRVALPNTPTTVGNPQRSLTAVITPDDPFPRWDFSSNYEGMISDNTITAPYTNLRAASGSAVVDASAKQFARLAIRPGLRAGASTLIGALLHWLKKEAL